MRNIIAIPLIGLAVIIQSAIVSQFPLLGGTADIVLVLITAWALQETVTTGFHWAILASVFVGIVSSLPWVVYFVGYIGIVVLALALQKRIWQVPMLAMFGVTFMATILLHLLTFIYLAFAGPSVPLTEALGTITLPTVLLNMLIAIPIFGFMRDVAGWVFPSRGPA